jgi:hypothetical protein
MKKVLTTRATTTTGIRGLLERNNRFIAAASILCFAVGLVLSHLIEPGVRIQKVTLAEVARPWICWLERDTLSLRGSARSRWIYPCCLSLNNGTMQCSRSKKGKWWAFLASKTTGDIAQIGSAKILSQLTFGGHH